MTIKIGFQQQVSKELIAKAQVGDMPALEEIYNTYAIACYNLSYRICGNSSLAQDIVQEVFIKIINSIDKYRNDGNIAGWIRRITTNESINRIKSENRLHLVDSDETENIPCNDLFGINWLNACRDLEGLLSQLSTTSRAVLFLHEVEGYNHKEIAKFYDRTESFSKMTLSRAYSSLRAIVLEQELKNAPQ